ncbi:hypothetical protein AMTRI_Chr13g125690 [Amborella trichopoda]|uniref:Chloride conductance regulatory protein ICln n=1 Tax=Amborella trichopoda TaxID=13333 RepID=U5CW56_AMBTC|nr:chloride conductance regulatory protein ICln [Amborella trichopoda]ERN17531.1 hypothetical protein AMTR_s00059p00102310 [Amborella trichopoda]|eukprot:XP_006856064.1 chloride conductance regulatory protein ICln [Amborella trichopoda]
MGLGFVEVTERGEAGKPYFDHENGEELMHVEPEIALVFGTNPPESPGTLYISSKRVVWLSDLDRRKGYAVDFLSVSLHAISRDPEAYPSPCIYAQIETEAASGEEDDSDTSDTEPDRKFELSKVTEMRLVPSNPSHLDTLFNVFCQCAEMNPDQDEEDGEDAGWVFGDEEAGDDDAALDEDSGWCFSENFANPIGHSNGVKDNDLSRTILEFQIDDQRFDDAEEMENDTHADSRR